MSTTKHPIPAELFADLSDDMEQANARRQQAAHLNADTQEVEVDEPDAVVPAGTEA